MLFYELVHGQSAVNVSDVLLEVLKSFIISYVAEEVVLHCSLELLVAALVVSGKLVAQVDVVSSLGKEREVILSAEERIAVAAVDELLDI